MVKDIWLPTSVHVKDLLEFVESIIKEKSKRSSKISLILIDNSIEIMLKEYLRHNKGLNPGSIGNMKFRELLNNSHGIRLVKKTEAFFMTFHEMRNEVYHRGVLLPAQEDVESGLSLSKNLFNELHSHHRLDSAHLPIEISLPSRNTMEFMKQSAAGKEVYLYKTFADFYRQNGYEVRVEPNLGANLVPDLMAIKDCEVILYEFKSNTSRVRPQDLTYLLRIVNMIKHRNENLNIEPRIAAKGKFSSKMIHIAKGYGITLIDDTNLKQYY